MARVTLQDVQKGVIVMPKYVNIIIYGKCARRYRKLNSNSFNPDKIARVLREGDKLINVYKWMYVGEKNRGPYLFQISL